MKFDGVDNPVDPRLKISIIKNIDHKIVIYKLNGKTHRENGPATIYYLL